MVWLNATTGFRAKWEFQLGVVGRGYQTFGLFLLGLWAGRRRLFRGSGELHRRLFVRLWRWTGALTLLLPVIGVVLIPSRPRSGRWSAAAAGRHAPRHFELAGSGRVWVCSTPGTTR